ncbi:MAG: prepilin-type N-terminal cleavage/methylation domain-containing protein [Dehalococcoidia bacterium]|nr:prepilin-type N-terminal cleavage/methylation domain-containing protein [Dehalococcoidia bacterium]
MGIGKARAIKHARQGFTLLEIVIGLAITGMLMTVAAAAVPAMMQWSPRQANKLSVEQDLAFARYWLTRDANAAESFTPLAAPQYGYLEWRDFRAEAMITRKVTYSYDSATDSLIREERQDNVIQTSLPVARRILGQSDVQFTWSPATYKLVVSVTSTIEDAPGVGDRARSETVVATLRPREEYAVSPPGETPAPPPLPGSQTYYVSGNPTIISGSLASGNGASLHDIDQSYYVVNSATVGGSKVVNWWCSSGVMSAPPTISQIEVRFTGKADKNNITMVFYVKDSAAGFPATPASGFTFTEANTDTTRSFYLDAATLAYVTSLPQRQVTLKVVATGSATFSLSTDQVIFIASP